jgi:hypothetical protein
VKAESGGDVKAPPRSTKRKPEGAEPQEGTRVLVEVNDLPRHDGSRDRSKALRAT